MGEEGFNGFRLIAHRGGLYYRPENTIAAFDYTVESGVFWAECDIRLSRDGVPVIFHDELLHIAGNGSIAVRDLDLKKLGKIDVGGGETVPALEDLFRRHGDKLFFDLELKEVDAAEKVIPLVRNYELQERSIITSFIPDALYESREIGPEIKRGLLVDRLTGNLVDIKSTVKAASLLGCDLLLPHYRLVNKDWVKKSENAGVGLIPWTVNDMRDAKRMLNYGVKGIISDRPDYFVDLVNSLG